MRREFRFSGFGGQGVLTLGKILGLAATIFDNYYAVQTESYGPESRGGTSHSDVIVADYEINSPIVLNSNVLGVMSQPALEEFYMKVHDDGIILYDSTMMSLDDKILDYLKKKSISVYGIDATSEAEKIGNSIVANIILLGALTPLDSTVSTESIGKAVLDAVPPETRELNEKAFNLGVELGRNLKNEAV